ncbi:ParB/Srx family N-terminal domain-containing protein [Sphingomonas sp. MG17]|uniref:ParB/Srx family N-terminal domain-containing protein n=1 Tax=Sphingomonas tagetis TaxID=2949092 RepID=A0A9X2KMU0_9SPHN|nr:ParB/Srx family N-terminal domain-containing protein [Sphingomonas tagetis]MCP3732160.1 ParB/Srx family N-terminal domain-containing protein [Sphingomonas tagetis]
MSDIIFVKAANCTKSPSNVRKSSDPEADAQLAANIAARGIIQNLVALPVARKKGHYRICAGGRRLDGVHANMAAGVFPADYEIPVKVLTDASDVLEISLSENFFNLEMNPADACRAFQDIIEIEKKTPADIAKRFGLTERFVRGRLRLANLAEPVFEALRENAITLDVAIAYASTSDTSRQASVFEQLAGSYSAGNLNEIRRQLAVGGYKGSDPKAVLVGREAYEAAGGRIDGDLFTDASSEMWLDGDIVDQLAEAALAAAAAQLREREGYAEVRVISAGHVPYMETCNLNRVVGEPIPLTVEAEGRKTAINAELEEIERVAEEAGDYSEEQSSRIEALEDELESLLDTGELVSEADRAAAIAFVVIGSDGQPHVHEQLYREPAEPEHEVDDGDSDDVDGERDAEPDDNAGPKYSHKLLDELAMMKTELLAVHVASDPHFALDLATFIMVDRAIPTAGYDRPPSELRASAPSPRVHGFESGAPAAEAWAKLEQALDRSWSEHKTLEARYDAFCALGDEVRAAWLGWAVARTLEAVPDGCSGSSFLSHLGTKLGIEVAAWWRPTARNFFDRITKPGILKLFEAIGGLELKSRYAASRKFDLAAAAEKLFSGQVIVENEVKERALVWLPDAMRFAPETQIGDPIADDQGGHGGGSIGERSDDVGADAESGATGEGDRVELSLSEAA